MKNLFLIVVFLFLGKSQLFSTPQKIGILVRGESFRIGGQHSRSVGSAESVALQQQVAHAFFLQIVEPLRLNGYEAYVFLNTYPSGCENQLPSMYPYATDIHIGRMEPLQWTPVTRALKEYSLQFPDIETWLIVRCDMLFKEPFTDKLLSALNHPVKSHKILGFFETHPHFGNKLKSGKDSICDTLFLVPTIYLNPFIIALDKAGHWGHYILDLLPNETWGGYLLDDEKYDSNTAKMRNPYYKLNSRPECE